MMDFLSKYDKEYLRKLSNSFDGYDFEETDDDEEDILSLAQSKKVSLDEYALGVLDDTEDEEVCPPVKHNKLSFDDFGFEVDDETEIDIVPKTTKNKPVTLDDIISLDKSFDNQGFYFVDKTKTKSKKDDNHKGKGKKKKKNKKKKQVQLNESLMMLHIDDDVNAGSLISILMRRSERFISKDKKLHIYNDELGCFEECMEDDFSIILNSLLNEDVLMKIKTSEYKEAYRQMCISHKLVTEEEFFENQPFVNCLNGVVDILDKRLLEHSPDYRFKHCIRANYIPGAKCPNFKKYVKKITNDDKELIRLLRVLLGYLFSHYNNAKIAILIISPPHTGKSVLCIVCQNIIGKDFVSNVDLAMLSRPEYAASLSGKLLNIAPDLKNVPLKDVGFFKSLVSHNDYISARLLYNNAKSIRGETKMVFSSNHLLEFDSQVDENDIMAVFNRLIYFPLQNEAITEDEENKHLSEDLFNERDAIFTWAMEGLYDFVTNGETFPKAKFSEQKKSENISKYCPEQVFVDSYIERKEGRFESVSIIKNTFSKFCYNCNAHKRDSIIKYIERRFGISETRKRIDKDGNMISSGGTIHVLPGIRLKKDIPAIFTKED